MLALGGHIRCVPVLQVLIGFFYGVLNGLSLPLTSSDDTIFNSMSLLPLGYIRCSQLGKALSLTSHTPAHAVGIQVLSLPKHCMLPFCPSATTSPGRPEVTWFQNFNCTVTTSPVIWLSQQPRFPLCSTPLPIRPRRVSQGPSRIFPELPHPHHHRGAEQPCILSSFPAGCCS